MVSSLFTNFRCLSLVAFLVGAATLPVHAGAGSLPTSATNTQRPIYLAQAQPQKTDPAPKKVNPWKVQCGQDKKSGNKFCRMQQSLRFKKTGQRLLAIIIQPQTIEPKIAILLSLPHGLFLPAGTAFKVDDGKENRMVIETCDVEGCYASGGLQEQQIEAMKKGEKLLVAFQASSKKPITIPISLSGFTAAYKKIMKDQ